MRSLPDLPDPESITDESSAADALSSALVAARSPTNISVAPRPTDPGLLNMRARRQARYMERCSRRVGDPARRAAVPSSRAVVLRCAPLDTRYPPHARLSAG